MRSPPFSYHRQKHPQVMMNFHPLGTHTDKRLSTEGHEHSGWVCSTSGTWLCCPSPCIRRSASVVVTPRRREPDRQHGFAATAAFYLLWPSFVLASQVSELTNWVCVRQAPGRISPPSRIHHCCPLQYPYAISDLQKVMDHTDSFRYFL